MNKIEWEKSIWFFDIDDTLVDSAQANSVGADEMTKILSKYFDDSTASKITDEFKKIFELSLLGHRIKKESEWENYPGRKEELQQLLDDIESKQSQIRSKFGSIKKWSREVLVKIASERVKVELTPPMIYEATDAYWMTMTEKVMVFPGVVELIKEIRSHNRPIFLITGSDGRLKIDDEGQFIYEPLYSERLKKTRVEILKSKGIDFDNVTVGDPEDKPQLNFFKKGMSEAENFLGQKIDYSNALMFGDSYTADLEVPQKQLEFGLVILFDRNVKGIVEHDNNFVSTDNLSEITKFLK